MLETNIKNVLKNRFDFWTECSGNIEAYWENAGGIRIPAAYIMLFMDPDTLKDIELDEDNPYVYTRVIARGEPHEQRIQKTIFGFPNQTVLNKYIEDQNTTLEEMCKKYGIDIDELNEGVMYRYAPEKIWPHLKLLKYYCEFVFKKERMEITQKECDVLTKAVRISYEVIAPVWERTNDKHIQDIYRLILRFAMELNRCNILRPYELGEYLELETEKFPTYKLMPTAF